MNPEYKRIGCLRCRGFGRLFRKPRIRRCQIGGTSFRYIEEPTCSNCKGNGIILVEVKPRVPMKRQLNKIIDDIARSWNWALEEQ